MNLLRAPASLFDQPMPDVLLAAQVGPLEAVQLLGVPLPGGARRFVSDFP